MIKIFQIKKDKINLPSIILIIAILIGLIHFFSYLVPITDNAFVVANTQPVAADVSGFITQIYVKNGQKVTKDAPLFKVFAEPYKLAYAKASADYNAALANVNIIVEQSKKNQSLVIAEQDNLNKLKYEYRLKNDPLVSKSIPQLEIQKLNYDIQSAAQKTEALKYQLAIDDKQILAQQEKIKALKAEMENAKINFDLTTVRAKSDGVVDNMYLSNGTPISQHQPLFSFISTDQWYVQANFNETDLRNVRPGDKATIILRMYYFDKIFHGVIVNNIWAADRQTLSNKTQQQTVNSENEWLKLPQRFPLQIKILDPDPNYPLNPGASAYVYIKPH